MSAECCTSNPSFSFSFSSHQTLPHHTFPCFPRFAHLPMAAVACVGAVTGAAAQWRPSSSSAGSVTAARSVAFRGTPVAVKPLRVCRRREDGAEMFQIWMRRLSVKAAAADGELELTKPAGSGGKKKFTTWSRVQLKSNGRGRNVTVRASSANQSVPRPSSQPRFIQHKQEAFWFYRFLSIVYDHIINPGHWTEDMREDALEPADLNDPNLVVVDVGGGTGFTTLGIVKTVDAKNVTILDQSPHQLEKAKEKAPLKECKIIEGDAEDLPFETDYADRYVSAGSIEYWPDPQRGIREAYRVLKNGGKACLIGPVHPTFWLSRFFADVWMLFPTEEEYIDWFTKAGFSDVQLKRIGPKWYRGVRRHGLIMGCSVTGVKTESGDSPLQLGPKAEDVKGPWNPLSFAYRFIVGGLASLYYVLVPIYMWLKDLVIPKGQPI